MALSSGKTNTKDVALLNIEKAVLYLSYKEIGLSDYIGNKDDGVFDYAWLFLIKDNKLYCQSENHGQPSPLLGQSEKMGYDRYCTMDNLYYYAKIAEIFGSFHEFAKKLAKDFIDGRLKEWDGDTSVLPREGKCKVTVFVGREKIHEETVFIGK